MPIAPWEQADRAAHRRLQRPIFRALPPEIQRIDPPEKQPAFPGRLPICVVAAPYHWRTQPVADMQVLCPAQLLLSNADCAPLVLLPDRTSSRSGALVSTLRAVLHFLISEACYVPRGAGLEAYESESPELVR